MLEYRGRSKQKTCKMHGLPFDHRKGNRDEEYMIVYADDLLLFAESEDDSIWFCSLATIKL